MMKANAVDTPAIERSQSGESTQRPGNMAGNAYRAKSFADNLNYRQKSGGSMPIPSRDTWSDWFDDADQVEQVTLDQLIERYPVHVTADQVRYWQKAGVLPQPVKRWHDGATRALYPATYAFMAIVEIQDLQERGYTLQQITTRLRTRFRAWNLGISGNHQGWQREAEHLAAEFSRMTGNTVDQVRIVFVDEDGSEDTYGYTIGSNHNE